MLEQVFEVALPWREHHGSLNCEGIELRNASFHQGDLSEEFTRSDEPEDSLPSVGGELSEVDRNHLKDRQE